MKSKTFPNLAFFLHFQVGTGPAAEQCVTDPAGAFRTEWEECLHAELLDEEKAVSDDMVKAWTNFAIHG